MGTEEAMTDKQKAAYEWAKSHPEYRSIAAGYARELAGLVDELTAELAETKRRVIAAAMNFRECDDSDEPSGGEG